MKYSIENNGHGFINIRLNVPESLLSQCLDFIHLIDKKTENKTMNIRNASSLRDDSYFIKLDETALTFFNEFVESGCTKNVALSHTLKKLKGINYVNISYDILKSRLTRKGCFKSKTADISR